MQNCIASLLAGIRRGKRTVSCAARGKEGRLRAHEGGGGRGPVEEGRAPPPIRMDVVREPLAGGGLQHRSAAAARARGGRRNRLREGVAPSAPTSTRSCGSGLDLSNPHRSWIPVSG
jgi:hypothetical protein